MCLRVEVVDFWGAIADTYGPMAVSTINLCFVVRILSGYERAQSDVAALKWFDSRSIPEKDLAFAHQIEVIRRWRRWISSRQSD